MSQYNTPHLLPTEYLQREHGLFITRIYCDNPRPTMNSDLAPTNENRHTRSYVPPPADRNLELRLIQLPSTPTGSPALLSTSASEPASELTCSWSDALPDSSPELRPDSLDGAALTSDDAAGAGGSGIGGSGRECGDTGRRPFRAETIIYGIQRMASSMDVGKYDAMAYVVAKEHRCQYESSE